MNVGTDLIALSRRNLFFTPHLKLILDQDGVELARRTILYHFDDPVDVIAIDPMRYVFDGGKNDRTENDNGAMRAFLQNRIDVLRDSVNPDAANILVHHTKKVDVDQLEAEGFQALSGASALHGYFSTGILIYRPDKQKPHRKVIFELRDGEDIEPKTVRKIEGMWCEDKPSLANNKADEPGRTKDVMLELIRSEAAKGNIYTMNQFCEEFSNKDGLGSLETVRRKLNALVADAYIKFFYDGGIYGLPNSSYGYMCVENMQVYVTATDEKTGTVTSKMHSVYPTHFKCKTSAAILSLEDQKLR